MSNSATFLHVSDTHLAHTGVPFPRDDHKIVIQEINPETRESVLQLTFNRLAEKLKGSKRRLDGVFFTGDAQNRGQPGGHEMLCNLLLSHFGELGVKAKNIVAIPGNHDVPRESPPSSPERYEDFIQVWRKRGCVTPWLDGVDNNPTDDGDPHRLVSEDQLWAVFPINTSNWSHAKQILPEPLASVWDKLPKLAAGDNEKQEAKIRQQLGDLARYDMARVSSEQLEILRELIKSTPEPSVGRQFRIALLHHHLRAPSLREELKPFADFSNLEQIRSFLRDREIAVVVHGHKHEHAAQFEHVYDQNGDRAHRILVISGATFAPGQESDAVRLITITGMPYCPEARIETIPIPRSGVDSPTSASIKRRIWSTNEVPGAPIVIQGSDLDEVYDRICEAAANEAKSGTLIVHLDLPTGTDGELPFPSNYPLPEQMEKDERQRWLHELVEWWQLERSGLDHRMPFVHGSRLRRYGGKIDQMKRIVELLKTKASTRAIAILIDPFRDFTEDGKKEEFASFCMVEFKRRDLDDNGKRHAVDVIAFYRAQEFARWWPINIAEMRYLQSEICNKAGPKFSSGRITTITADARIHSRSPTQVTMPIIDRWLDQAPERLHVLANALMQGGEAQDKWRKDDAVRGWDRTLADLKEAATSKYNPDGLPIAIEGLERLASYIKAANSGKNPTLAQIVSSLERLARVNKNFENGAHTKEAFDRWADDVSDVVEELCSLTQKRLGNV